MNLPPKVVVFDAFGTIVKIGTKRSPYRQLMKWLQDQGRKPDPNDAKTIMSNALNITQLAAHFNTVPPTQLLNEIINDLQLELDTMELYEDSIPILETLKRHGIKTALCSNLALPYGNQLKNMLPDSVFDSVFLSYEVGAIKPENTIYEAIQKQFNCNMSDMLFIGDNPILDVEKPISLGMNARLIKRNEGQLMFDLLDDII